MTTLPHVDVSQRGGDVAMDLFNTVDWRLDPTRAHERLTSYAHVLTWMHVQGLLAQEQAEALAVRAGSQPDDAGTEHALILALRDDTYRALTDGTSPQALESSLRETLALSHLNRSDDGRWTWTADGSDLGTPRRMLALALQRLLASDEMQWFHRCEDDHCGWVFLDTSRQHNRRWCSSADCGNRNRVRAHHAREKQKARR